MARTRAQRGRGAAGRGQGTPADRAQNAPAARAPNQADRVREIAEQMNNLQRLVETQGAQIERGQKRQEDADALHTKRFSTLLGRLPIPPNNSQNYEVPPATNEEQNLGPQVIIEQPVQPVEAPRAARAKPISERFGNQNPPIFEGSSDPSMAEEWISILERIFDFIGTTEREKVVCATYMLRNDARIWWDATKKGNNVAEMEWLEFLTLFNGKYYSKEVIEHKENEFTNLKQGTSSVQDYF